MRITRKTRNILNKLLASLMFIAAGILLAQDIPLPTYPVEPGSPQTTEKKNSGASIEKTRKTEVMVILGTNDEIRGYIYLPEKISFRHYKNGLVYQKTIEPDDLQSLTISKYAQIEAGEHKKSTFYQFEPSVIDIKSNDGGSYRIEKIFPFLKSFIIDTNNGRTKLFTIFGDSYETGKGWSNVESKDIHYHDTKPHPASVKKIIFLRVDKEP